MKNKNKKNGTSSLGHFLWINILQARMWTRWRQLSILSTNQQESASFAQKKGPNSGTRIVLFSCWEQNCERQFYLVWMLIILCSYKQTHTYSFELYNVFIFQEHYYQRKVWIFCEVFLSWGTEVNQKQCFHFNLIFILFFVPFCSYDPYTVSSYLFVIFLMAWSVMRN